MFTPQAQRTILLWLGIIGAGITAAFEVYQAAEGTGTSLTLQAVLLPVFAAMIGKASKAPGTLTVDEADAKATQARIDATAATRAALGFSEDDQ